MFVLPEEAYPFAAKQFIEAARDFRRKIREQPVPEYGSHAWRALARRERFDVNRLLHSFFHEPLRYARLHRVNWKAERPALYVSLNQDDREGVKLSVSSSDQVEAVWDYGFRNHYVAAAGDFRDGFYDLTLLEIPLEYSFVWSFDDRDHRFQAAPLRDSRDERRLSLLAIQSRLHYLSQFFECRMPVRLVEFGPDCLVDWREPRSSYSEDNAAFLESENWAAPRLVTLLEHSDVSPSDLYRFATGYLCKLDEKRRPEVLGQYLGNSRTGTVTQEDVKELMKLCDEKYRRKLWLSALETDARFTGVGFESRYKFDLFAKKAGFSEEQALAWILKHHPQLFETYTPYVRHVRRLLDQRNAKQLSAKASVALDHALARDITNGGRFSTGTRALRELERVASGLSFESFDELVAWTRKKTPVAHRAALDLAEKLTRVANEAKAAAAIKRAETRKTRAGR